MICNMLLINGKTDQKTVVKVLDAAYVAALCLALLQLVVPANICTELFRNSSNVGYRIDGARISGPFNEPSMLALVCTPFFCGYLYRLINKFSFKYLLYAALFLAVMLNNQSSSAVLGVFVGVILIVFVNLFDYKKKFRNKDLVWILIVLLSILIFAVFASSLIGDTISMTLQKLNGEGRSGSERLYSFVHHMNIFLDHFFLGIGYGTVRSFDLLSTWACEVGIIGLLLYFVPIITLCFKLFKLKSVQSIQLLINIVVYNAILFSSACEVSFLQIWIIYGLGFYIVQNREYEKTDNSYSELPSKA
ncbi:MAG: O-antigen ligase family protein [Oscillospiraceae bacterium]